MYLPSLIFIFLCQLNFAYSWFFCYYDGSYYFMYKRIWKTDCEYCDCKWKSTWKCENICGTPKPSPQPNTLPICPTTKLVEDPGVIPSNPAVVSCDTRRPIKKGDYIIFDYGRVITFYSILYNGKVAIFHKEGLSKFSVSLSNDNENFYHLDTINLSTHMGLLLLKNKYSSRFIKLTLIESVGTFCPKFQVKGCRALSCSDCEFPEFCRDRTTSTSINKFLTKSKVCGCKPGHVLNSDERTCSALPICPTTKLIEDPGVIPSNPAVVSCDTRRPIKKGDYIIFDYGRVITFYSILYDGKVAIFHKEGLSKFSVSLSNDNETFHPLDTIDLSAHLGLLRLNYKYSARFVKFTIIDSVGRFCPKFKVKGCQGTEETRKVESV